MNKTAFPLVNVIVEYLLTLAVSPFYIFLTIEMFTIAAMLVTGTGIEKVFVWFIINTPFLAPKGMENNYSYGISEVMWVASFWSAIFSLGFEVIRKKFEIGISFKYVFSILSGLHILALIKFLNQLEMYPVIIFFYICSVFCLFPVYVRRKIRISFS